MVISIISTITTTVVLILLDYEPCEGYFSTEDKRPLDVAARGGPLLPLGRSTLYEVARHLGRAGSSEQTPWVIALLSKMCHH
jgi:hypothetical protein